MRQDQAYWFRVKGNASSTRGATTWGCSTTARPLRSMNGSRQGRVPRDAARLGRLHLLLGDAASAEQDFGARSRWHGRSVSSAALP